MTVNTIMKGWEVQSTVPPLYLGECGENNALTVSIEIEEDEVISAEDFPDVEYYLDIYDESGNIEDSKYTTDEYLCADLIKALDKVGEDTLLSLPTITLFIPKS